MFLLAAGFEERFQKESLLSSSAVRPTLVKILLQLLRVLLTTLPREDLSLELYSCCAEDDFAYLKTKDHCPVETHTLPDGQVITIGREIYTVGEALFQPSLLGLEAHGIVEQLVCTISTVTYDNHRQLLENTVVCGGTSSMTG
ncbi:actin-related protein 7-like [Vicia villosa]|uniref:actin-related protein 7-like n=1 Tax=Vicia villosa TaxID=3911 RepID=UPI00273C15AE|nr:actin-related protein 7-like [Vicia villosa]